MINTKYYRVEYKGVLSEYEIIRYEAPAYVYAITQITNLRKETYRIIPEIERKAFGTSKFPIPTLNDEWFDNLKDAKTKSKERFDKEVNPNGKYRVARYFDDIWEAWESEELSKADAKTEAKRLNQKDRHYVSYNIVNIK